MSAKQSDYAFIENGAIAMLAGRIAWVGDDATLPKDFVQFPTTDLGSRLVTPSFIDCHTHIVHGGNRAMEFELRLKGKSYEAIAKAGGGIISTVSATRGASEDKLLEKLFRALMRSSQKGLVRLKSNQDMGLIKLPN